LCDSGCGGKRWWETIGGGWETMDVVRESTVANDDNSGKIQEI